MPETQADSDLTKEAFPWKTSPVVQENFEEVPNKGNTFLGRKTLFIGLGLLFLLIGGFFASLTGFVDFEQIIEKVPVISDKKYETASYEVVLPRNWDVDLENDSISGTDPKKPVRRVAISEVDYDQASGIYGQRNEKIREVFEEAATKEREIYMARWRTSECKIDKAIGSYCERIYYLWSDEVERMVKLEIRWEKWELAEIAKDEAAVKKYQSLGGPTAHPTIEEMEKKIFKSFEFKTAETST